MCELTRFFIGEMPRRMTSYTALLTVEQYDRWHHTNGWQIATEIENAFNQWRRDNG